MLIGIFWALLAGLMLGLYALPAIPCPIRSGLRVR